MKILAFSDSHNDINGMIYPLQKETPDVVMHLGDNVDDAIRLEKMFPDICFYMVKGNCDFINMESEKIITLDNTSFLITHGHKYSVKSTYERIIKKGKEKEADVILFGHTHIAFCEKQNNIWVINPGSSSALQTRDRNPSYCRLVIDDDAKLLCDIITR
jgi:putative phosphoesterase